MAGLKNFKKELIQARFKCNNSGKYGDILNSDMNEKLINQRVVSDEHFATIKYVGTLPKSSGIWFGVDWDDETRGRHDGSHDGIRYFNTHAINSGSFVRPGKVSLGLTIEEAINMRYGCDENSESNYGIEEFFLESSDSDDECGTNSNVIARSNTHQKVKVHITGPTNGNFNINGCQFDKLRSAVLHSLPMFRCMTAEEGGGLLGTTFPVMDELDIAQTLISDWVEVAKICIQLKTLKTLNVSDNNFIPMYPSSNIFDRGYNRDIRKKLYQNAFQNIEYLVLVRIFYEWKDLIILFDETPRIQHICLAYNRLSTIQPALHHNFILLSYLDLACNQISNFGENILPFGSLLHLHTLLLNDNLIDNIILPGSCDADTDLFPNLRLLAISNNKISSWDSIHHISRIKGLNELIFMYNPILEIQKNQETARQDVIAKLPKIKILNRNEIKYDERKGAEIDYMKRYGKKWLEAQAASGDSDDIKDAKLLTLNDFKREHPRFIGLANLYGAPEQSEMKEVSRKLKERLIEVIIQYGSAGENGGICELKKKIPNHMTVQHLRVLLRRLCKIPAKFEFELCYVSGSRPLVQIPLEAETREIGFYNVQTGDHVIVHVMDGTCG